MGALIDMFGDEPRVRGIEALIRLAPMRDGFTISEFEQEANFKKKVGFKLLHGFEEMGLVKQLRGRVPLHYVVDRNSKVMNATAFMEAGLGLLRSQDTDEGKTAVSEVIPEGSQGWCSMGMFTMDNELNKGEDYVESAEGILNDALDEDSGMSGEDKTLALAQANVLALVGIGKLLKEILYNGVRIGK
jgi:hypothetical protein